MISFSSPVKPRKISLKFDKYSFIKLTVSLWGSNVINIVWMSLLDKFNSSIHEEISYRVVGHTSGQLVKPKKRIVGLAENIFSVIVSPLCEIRLKGSPMEKGCFSGSLEIFK